MTSIFLYGSWRILFGLKEDVKELQAELAALAKLQAEMDKIRSESHADYVN